MVAKEQEKKELEFKPRRRPMAQATYWRATESVRNKNRKLWASLDVSNDVKNMHIIQESDEGRPPKISKPK